MKTLVLFSFASASTFAALPSVGPDYRRPDIPTAVAYRDVDTGAAWKVAAPNDAIARGAWWTLFADPGLDALETRALSANQDLRAAAARVEQARAAAGLARSNYWPQIAVDPSVTRQRFSQTVDNAAPVAHSTIYDAPLVASWELDLFGRVRRLTESARADAEASAANFASVQLSLTADVASNYFSLRALDRESAVIEATIALRRRELELVNARRQGGTVGELDLARAETELAQTETESAALANRRAAVQTALAVLLGVSATEFGLDSTDAIDPTSPSVPVGLPAALLERRPDIAAAERALAAANARIGVAQAAFFPAISLTGSAGYASGEMDRLFTSDSRAWSIGPSVYLPIFQGGRNRANLARSRAVFDEAVAVFRQRVLVAFQEVQDALTATRLLATQSAAQDRSLASARRASQLAQIRYDAGYVSYLEVIDAQRTSLAIERASVQLAAQRLNTSVALIKSLGGGWHPSSL